MQNIISPEDFVYLKYLLGIIGILVGSQVALLIFFGKKYIKRADIDHERLNVLETEHKVFHKKETSINS